MFRPFIFLDHHQVVSILYQGKCTMYSDTSANERHF